MTEAATDEAEVRFTESERAALRDIVIDWINEQLMLPPYPPEVASVIEKLGLLGESAVEELGISKEAMARGGAPIVLRPNLG
jgi:hypothetical protein